MIVIKRPPGDLFTFRLFYQMDSTVTIPKDSIYIWSAAIDPANIFKYWKDEKWHHEDELYFRDVILKNLNKDAKILLLGVKDHLTSGDFNPWEQEKPVMVEYLENLIDYFSDRPVVLFTSVENLNSYINKPNVHIVPWGGDITNHFGQYQRLTPVTEKNLDSKYIYVSLNRNQRTHRAVLLGLLYGLRLEKHGLISCMFKDKCDNLFRWVKWKFTTEQQHIKMLVEMGYDQFKLSELPINDDINIYPNHDNDNVSNFKNTLSKYYAETFVEIVTETSFTEKSYLLTEKTLNSIYACNFPIILAGQGAVKLLRSMGMDMFDDIIDHSYDDLENPIDRLYAAISKNQRLLTDIEYVKTLWVDNKDRFLSNVQFARTTMYEFYTNRAKNIFQQLDLNK
jgi:hypothetical protein